MKLSVIVPAYNAAQTIPTLLDSLAAQTFKDFEVLVVDDGSEDHTAALVEASPCRLIALAENHGPAHCRNIGARHARGDILVFTDSDCQATGHWLESIVDCFNRSGCEAVMGRLIIRPSTLLGDAIAALGFPAGGALGFDKIWRVDAGGLTDSLSTCNCAVRKVVFEDIGGFDESFPYAGGEDSLLAYHLRRKRYRIKYCPTAVVLHAARTSLKGFLAWQFRRGISSYLFSTKVTDRRKFVHLRLWSSKNILQAYGRDRRLPLIVALLGASCGVQLLGFLFARFNPRF